MSRDKKLSKEFQGLPCRACFTDIGTVGHHLLTVGAHPEHANKRWNLMPLCVYHHREIHDIGLQGFVKRYNLQEEMYTRGFDYCDYAGKWIKPV